MTSIPPLNTTVIPPSSSPSSSTAAPSADSMSPLSRSNTFPHKTNPSVSTQTPLNDTSTPAINEEPVELDGGAVDIPPPIKKGLRAGCMRSPGDEEDIDGEFLGEGRKDEATAKRAAILASRSKDPSVIVDVPREPTAEEVHAARSAEGLVTPGLGQREFGGTWRGS